jgi:hypothetical protein
MDTFIAVLNLRICHYQVVFCKTDVSLSLFLFEYVKKYKRKHQTMHKVKVLHFIFQTGKNTRENENHAF